MDDVNVETPSERLKLLRATGTGPPGPVMPFEASLRELGTEREIVATLNEELQRWTALDVAEAYRSVIERATYSVEQPARCARPILRLANLITAAGAVAAATGVGAVIVLHAPLVAVVGGGCAAISAMTRVRLIEGPHGMTRREIARSNQRARKLKAQWEQGPERAALRDLEMSPDWEATPKSKIEELGNSLATCKEIQDHLEGKIHLALTRRGDKRVDPIPKWASVIIADIPLSMPETLSRAIDALVGVAALRERGRIVDNDWPLGAELGPNLQTQDLLEGIGQVLAFRAKSGLPLDVNCLMAPSAGNSLRTLVEAGHSSLSGGPLSR